MRTITNMMIPMRDGVRLATDLYLPDKEGAYPLILMRTPYDKRDFGNDPLYADYPRYVAQGYIVAVQDCRGTVLSEGTINQNGANEHEDGYDTVEYLAAQPFSDGNVGMFGLSYFGFTQHAAASMRPPHLKATCPFMCCSLSSFGTGSMQTVAAFHLSWAYDQLLERKETYFPDPGVREKVVPLLESFRDKLGEYASFLPMTDNPAANIPGVPMLCDYVELAERVEDPEFWKSIHSPMDYDGFHTAMLHGTGWMDAAVNNTIDNYLAARKSKDAWTRENSKLLIGPWTHGGVLPDSLEGVDFGRENSGHAQDVTGMMIRWFDRYLKGKETDCFPGRVRYFVMNKNEWRESAEWPPEDAVRTRLYLADDLTLGKDIPEKGELPLVYDPADPAPSFHVDKDGRAAFADWSEIRDRKDMLFFSSGVFDEGCTIAGDVRARLHVVTDVPDTDFAVRLTDIAPDGYERQITTGFVRARHRNGLFTEDFLTPGEAACIDFAAGYAGYFVAPGHRIGLQLAGSLFPQYNRNLNTKEAPSVGKEFTVAHDRILTGAEYASFLELPVLAR